MEFIPEGDIFEDPFQTFHAWYQKAQEAKIPFADAMTLATADEDGRPDARIVLFKGIEEDGLMFFTNYGSEKARQLRANPFAVLVFHWATLERQIRIGGRVEKASREISEKYFQSRPRGSQIGAWSSPQSLVIKDRKELESRVASFEKQYLGREIPCPEFWGGFRIIPDYFEFWQGRESRLHDRFMFKFVGGGWRSYRLAP